MSLDKRLHLVKKFLRDLYLRKNEKEEIYIFMSENIDQLFEMSQSTVNKIKYLKDKYPETGKIWWR